MNRIFFILLTIMITAAGITACSGEASPANGTTGGAVTSGGSALAADYRDALPVDVQLAIGTLQLEGSDLALTADQAETLLPYWRVLQSLTQSGSAAEAEVNAVLNQIQGGLNAEQIAAIAAMQLTEEKLQTMLDDGTLQIGFGRGFGGSSETGNGRLSSGFPGGGPGGGGPGGGPGGLGGGPGGFGGDPGAVATRQAEMEASGENPLMTVLTTNSAGMVIRLLENKTGAVPQGGGFGGFGAALAVAGELSGLSEQELGDRLRDGQTLGEVLEAHDVSLDEARQALQEALADTPLPAGQELDAWIDGLLTGSFGAGRPVDQAPQ